MKTFLIATALSIATTTAFGAASVRAPQLGGGTTGATASTPTTARAGTMRAQTMKTTSVSTPASVTTTQSIATPVSTETTDARIALLKGIKGFSSNKIKETSANAQQELNNINSQIEELQAQLDRAEATQSTVLTEANIDAKIDEKLSVLGASSGIQDTYSKTEVDNLLDDIKRKLLTIDKRGNINLTSATGTTSVQLLPYYLYATHTHALLGHSMTYRLYTPHNFGTTNWISLAPEYTSNWINDICAPYRSDPDFLACGFWGASGPGMTMTEFYVARCTSGFGLFWTNHVGGVESSRYVTYENLSESQVREHFCGTTPTNLCWISDYEVQTSMGDCTPRIFYVNISDNMPPEPEYYFNYIGGDHGIAMGGNALTYLQYFATNAPLDSTAIDDFVDSYCGDREPFWCGKNGVSEHSGWDDWLNIKERFHGYVLSSIETSDVGTYSTYSTNEDEPATYINTNVCGNPNGTTSCYVVNVRDLSLEYPGLIPPEGAFIDDRYRVTVFTTPRHETELPAPLIK